jgi:hypothetical protein
MVLNRYGLCLCASSVKTECWGILLLKQNVGVLYGALRGPRSDAHPFLACYGYAIILWVCVYVHLIIFL